jgi:myosin heavy subunit
MDIFKRQKTRVMVRPLSSETRETILRLWLDGYNYRAIRAQLVEGELGSISSVINEARRRSPGLDELREFKKAVGGAGTTVMDAARGARFMARLDESHLTMDFDSTLRTVNFVDRYGESADDALEAGLKMQQLESKSGKTSGQLLRDYEKLQGLVKQEGSKLESTQQEVGELREALGELEPLRDLKSKLEARGISTSRLDGFITFYDRLRELGFTEAAAEAFATEMSTHGTTPTQAARALGEALAEFGTLRKGLDSLRTTLSQMSDERDQLEGEIKKKGIELEKEIVSQGQVEQSITEMKGTYTKEEKRLREKKKRAEEMISELESEVGRLEGTKQKLDEYLESAEKTLASIEERAKQSQRLQLILSMFSEKLTIAPRKQMYETMVAIGGSFFRYLYMLEQQTPQVQALESMVAQMDRAIGDMIRAAG